MSTEFALVSGYDIIGDIHGYASKLECLLAKLGYQISDGCYRHPCRQVAFVGDYIDRGPQVREALKIVRAMVDRGAAYAVMGNHEFNAITYSVRNERGGWLREHSVDHARQHSATICQIVNPYPLEWRDWIDWFTRLPLALQLNGVRVVHAAWQNEYVNYFSKIHSISASLLLEMVNPQTFAGAARERLLSGIKIPIPFSGPSSKGFMRAKWWIDFQSRKIFRYRDLALPGSDFSSETPIPDIVLPTIDGYYPSSAPPVFTGHYRLPPHSCPKPLASNVGCLDYSVASGGPLVAYRWQGERVLRDENYVLS